MTTEVSAKKQNTQYKLDLTPGKSPLLTESAAKVTAVSGEVLPAEQLLARNQASLVRVRDMRSQLSAEVSTLAAALSAHRARLKQSEQPIVQTTEPDEVSVATTEGTQYEQNCTPNKSSLLTESTEKAAAVSTKLFSETTTPKKHRADKACDLSNSAKRIKSPDQERDTLKLAHNRFLQEVAALSQEIATFGQEMAAFREELAQAQNEDRDQTTACDGNAAAQELEAIKAEREAFSTEAAATREELAKEAAEGSKQTAQIKELATKLNNLRPQLEKAQERCDKHEASVNKLLLDTTKDPLAALSRSPKADS